MAYDMYGYGMYNGGLFALMAGMIVFLILIVIAVYIYLGFAFMAIARKAKLKMPGLAWIPFVGPLIIAYQTSKMHWWPWLLLIGYVVPVIGWIAQIAFAVFAVIWLWKMFEKIKRPGWWAILCIIPIVNFVLFGIAAWSKK
jgi:hypothetical protein